MQTLVCNCILNILNIFLEPSSATKSHSYLLSGCTETRILDCLDFGGQGSVFSADKRFSSQSNGYESKPWYLDDTLGH